MNSIFEYLNPSYKGAASYPDACRACESSIDGTFSTKGARLRHFSAHRIESYYPSANTSTSKDVLRIILRSAGEKAKKAFLEHQNLTSRDTFTLLTVQIPICKESRDYFSNRDPVVVTRHATAASDNAKVPPIFNHWKRDLRTNGDYTFLPIELRQIMS